jgi:hypothetical protein
MDLHHQIHQNTVNPECCLRIEIFIVLLFEAIPAIRFIFYSPQRIKKGCRFYQG